MELESIHLLERAVIEPSSLRGNYGVPSVGIGGGMAVCVGLGVTEGIGLGVAA